MTKEQKKKYQWTWYCQTCDQYFRTSRNLAAHKKVHPQKCKYCGKIFNTVKELCGHYVSLCEKQPDREEIIQRRKNNNKHIPHKHTQQAKQKIRQAHKKFLQQHPQKHPWKKKDKFISKPCQQLKQFLIGNSINFYPEYQCPLQFQKHYYSIDIAFPNQKIAIEINGDQHYNKNGNLKPYYKKRHDIIEQAGWRIYQIPFNETYKQQFRQSLLKLIKQNVNFNYDYTEQIKQRLKQKQLRYICPVCGRKKNYCSKICINCYRQSIKKQKKKTISKKKYIHNYGIEKCLVCGKEFKKKRKTSKFCSHDCQHIYRKQNIPSKQQLLQDLKQLHSLLAIGRKYNKSDNAVKRWFKMYDIV